MPKIIQISLYNILVNGQDIIENSFRQYSILYHNLQGMDEAPDVKFSSAGSVCACNTAFFLSKFIVRQCMVRFEKQSLLTTVPQVSVVKLYHSTFCNFFLMIP